MQVRDVMYVYVYKSDGGKCSDCHCVGLNDVKWWAPQGKIKLARPGHRWEDSINVVLEDFGVGHIWLRKGTGGELF